MPDLSIALETLKSMKANSLNTFLTEKNIQLTALRRDVFAILFEHAKPMGAYEILNQLKKIKPNAEPPTVYRALNYLVTSKLVHRIESQNTYLCCSKQSQPKHEHQTILLFCQQCQHGFEYEDQSIFQALKEFTQKNNIAMHNVVIELKGECEQCHLSLKPTQQQ